MKTTAKKKEATAAMDLRSFSEGLDRASDRREQERKEHHDKIANRLVLFVPDEENPKFGVGYFRMDDGFVAYQRMANKKYERYPCWQVSFEMLDTLAKLR